MTRPLPSIFSSFGLAFLVAILAPGCTEESPLTSGALLRPVDMTTYCVAEAFCSMTATPLTACEDDATECGVITNAELGDLALVQISTGQAIDGDPFVPGITRRTLGGVPGAVVMTPDGEGILTVDTSASDIIRVTTSDWWAPLERQPLPGPAHELVVATRDDVPVVVVPIPTLQQIVVMPLELLGTLSAEEVLASHSEPFPGIPGRQAHDMTEDGSRVWITHGDRAAVSVLDLASDTLVTLALSGPCVDGEDNDLDGLVDGEDPECVASGSSVESGEPEANDASFLPDIALTPDGAFAYVTDRRLRQVHVVDATTLSPVNITARSGQLGNPVHASEGRTGIVLPHVPAAIAFAPSTLTENEEELPTQTAFISTTSGILHLIDATVAGEPRHLRRASQDSESSLGGFPLWTLDGVVLSTSFVVRTDLPNLGPFGDTTDVDSPLSTTATHGVSLTLESRHVESEFWSLTHEAVLPFSLRNGGGLVAEEPRFEDPQANHCALGVEPGDVLLLTAADVEEDSRCDPWRVDHLEFEILEVTPTSLLLNDAGACAVVNLEVEEDADSTAVVAPPPPTLIPCGPFQRLESETEVVTTVGIPPVECIQKLQSSHVRAPRGTFLVSGAITGHLHPWKRLGDECVLLEENPLIQGRAYEAQPAENAAPVSCDLPLEDTLFDTETPFANPVISFNIRPGCDLRDGDIGPEFVPTARDVAIQVATSSGFVARILTVGGIIERVRSTVLGDMLHLIDTALNRVIPLAPDTLEAGVTIN